MPFGSIPWTSRLGIANYANPSASGFGYAVLNLTPPFPVYQQQIVRNQGVGYGPPADAAWCGTQDDDSNRLVMVREASPVHHYFGRRNLTANNSPWSLINHKNNWGQIYYVMNEPEATSRLSSDTGNCSGCWQALDFNIDTMVAACYSNSLPPFWQGFKGVAQGPCISSTNIAEQRIHPYALAFSFFKIREQASSNNTVLPGSSTNVSLGADWASLNAQQTLQAVNDGNYDAGLFWQAFYDAINAGVASNCSPNFYTISRDQLKALHVHQYDWTFYWTDPAVIDNGIANGTISPLGSVAWNATVLRKGADWFRSRYNSNADIPLDIYVSEFGQDWRLIYGPDATGIVNDQYGNHRDWHQYVWPRTWAGGWRGFKSVNICAD